ncbi:MAG: diguanylate cyclase [bacterium]|nr:diguanylate cyclase [bacterium]
MNKEKVVSDKNKPTAINKAVTTPISQEKLVSKVNELTRSSSASPVLSMQNAIFKSETSNYLNYKNYKNILEKLVEISDTNDITEFYNKIYSIILENVDSHFFAVGLYKEQSNCINLRLQDKLENTYSTKIFLKDTNNPIIQVFNSHKQLFVPKQDYLKLFYYKNCSTAIFPLISANKCIGVFIIEEPNAQQNATVYNIIARFIALVTHNHELTEKSEEYVNTDALTLLYNHRGFQEILSNEIKRAETTQQKLSVIMMDINNITKINRELGHAKGDEVIKLVAEKVRQNVRKGDIAGRYGGDEIAVILPNTSSEQAKYVAEYLTYSLSCCFIDNIGPIKVSVGVATYPDCSDDKEKLLILAEQAMYISQAKGYKDGMSAIISSKDFNFWDDVALKSYAEVVTKRHTQLGINFEDELIAKFHNEDNMAENKIWDIARSLASAIDAKDPYTKGHSTSVSKFSEALARAINLPEKEIQKIVWGALLHDVGKIGIPENVLKKEGPLSDDEWKIMKRHPIIGVDKVLRPNASLHNLIPIVKYHHERIDGKGYPDSLRGEEIPLEAKIVAIADTYHALISDRPYRKGMNIEKAVSILEEGAGTQWDADLVRTFIQIAPSLGV